MNKYELMYIIDASFEDEPRKELIERVSKLITDNGGTVDKIDEWGKRRLAYAINYKNEGYYVLVNFQSAPELPREIERVLQINENVLRYLIVKIEEKKTHVKPRQTPLRPAYGRPVEQPDVVLPPTDAPAAPVEAAPQAAAEPVEAQTPAEAPAPVAEAPAEPAQQDA